MSNRTSPAPVFNFPPRTPDTSEATDTPQTIAKACARFPVFARALRAAQACVPALLVQEGVFPNPAGDRHDYYTAIDAVVAEFGDFLESNLDGICSLDELMAKEDAAYVLGLAVGLQLAGLARTSGKDGAR